VPAVWPAKRGGRPARLARCRARVGGRLRPVRTRRGPRRPGDATPERGFGRRLGSLVWAHCRGQPSRAAPASPPRRFPRWRRARGPSFRRIPGWRGSRPLRRSLPASAPTSTRTGGIESAATTTGWPADCGLWALRLPWAPRSGGGSRDGGLNDIERLRVQASPSLAAATDRREVDEFLAAGRGAPARGGGREGAERPTPRARGALRRRDDRGRAGEGVGLARLARRRAGRPSALRVLAPVGVPDHYYYFYLRDRDWGPAFVKTVAYAPFPIWIYLNGHRWAKARPSGRGSASRRSTTASARSTPPLRCRRSATPSGPARWSASSAAGRGAGPPPSPRPTAAAAPPRARLPSTRALRHKGVRPSAGGPRLVRADAAPPARARTARPGGDCLRPQGDAPHARRLPHQGDRPRRRGGALGPLQALQGQAVLQGGARAQDRDDRQRHRDGGGTPASQPVPQQPGSVTMSTDRPAEPANREDTESAAVSCCKTSKPRSSRRARPIWTAMQPDQQLDGDGLRQTAQEYSLVDGSTTLRPGFWTIGQVSAAGGSGRST
jgi:hypothetical protein